MKIINNNNSNRIIRIFSAVVAVLQPRDDQLSHLCDIWLSWGYKTPRPSRGCHRPCALHAAAAELSLTGRGYISSDTYLADIIYSIYCICPAGLSHGNWSVKCQIQRVSVTESEPWHNSRDTYNELSAVLAVVLTRVTISVAPTQDCRETATSALV